MSTVTADKEDTSHAIGLPLRTGIFLVVSSWFVYVVYELVLGIYNRHTTIPLVREDIAATVGLAFVVVASSIAVLTMLYFVLKRDLSKPELTMAARMALFAVGVYFVLAFLPSVFVEGVPWGFHFTDVKYFEVTLPCLVNGVAIPAVIAKLFLTLNPYKPPKQTIKWSFILGTVYLFAFWVNNSSYWIGTVISKGAGYITSYPINMLSFLLTTVGLLLLSLYTAYFSKKTIRKETLAGSDLKKVGLILSATGLYLTFTLLLWFIFGSVGGWSNWYAWLLGHGYLDLWGLTLPFTGLPLLFMQNSRAQASSKPTYSLLFAVQALGVAFYAVLSAAYYIPIPSTKVLIGEPIFKTPITVFGLVYFILVIVAIVLSLQKTKLKTAGVN